MKKLNRFYLMSLALLLGLGVSAQARDTRTDTAQATLRKDEILTQNLQQAFSERFDLRNISVDVDDRIATLKGTVQNYRDKLEAERLARKQKGIEGVRNDVAVIPSLSVSDVELREQIANRLRYDRIGSGITFNNFAVGVKEGVVTISGEARSYPDKASALAIIQDTPGVRDVQDEIKVLPLSPFDDELRLRTAMAIYRDPVLQKYALDPQASIRIIVENGHVKLYGVVNSDMEKHIAELRAREVSGVFSVEDNLIVANSLERKLTDSNAGGAGGSENSSVPANNRD